MKITNLKVRNLLGIKEFDYDGKNIEITGDNGVGKSSVINAIRLALQNKIEKDFIIRQGESEAEILLETDTGLTINRKYRANKGDYKSIKQDGKEIQSPEAFLQTLFETLQLNPIEFLNMKTDEQNAIILDMIKFEWDMTTIKEWFNEIPTWPNYQQNILAVLNEVQSEKGDYYLNRQDINRDIRNKQAIVEDIGKALPDNYTPKKWEEMSLSETYQKIEKIKQTNNLIEKAQMLQEQKENKIRSFEADRQIQLNALDREISTTEKRIDLEIQDLQAKIKALEVERSNLGEKKQDRIKVIDSQYNTMVAKFNSTLSEYSEYLDQEIQPTNKLEKEAQEIETMKSYARTYYNMTDQQKQIKDLADQSENLTKKIELARKLPGQILENAELPLDNLTVVDGKPLINGLPISNLSDGQKFDLCCDIAIQNPAGFKIILIDGIDLLSEHNRKTLYDKCKAKGLQFIATRVDSLGGDFTVIEL